MASRGSVIPLWVEQIMAGKPITITDPSMTRFMMTLDDAVDLVIYAFTHGHNGDLFVQKAPAATLETLAEALKQIYSKLDPKYGETEVKVIGTRHGEKLGPVVGRVYTLLAVCLGFVMFRAGSVEQGFAMIGAMFTGFTFTASGTVALHSILTVELAVMTVLGIVMAMPVLPKLQSDEKLSRILEPVSWPVCLVLFVLCLARLASGGFTPFIYFQF